MGQRVWGCQLGASLAPLIAAPAFADPWVQPWQGTGSSTASSRTCRVSAPARPLPACPLHGTSHPGHAGSLLAPSPWAAAGCTAGGAPEHPSANSATDACSCPRCQPQVTASAWQIPVPLAPPAPPFHPRAGSSFTHWQKSPGWEAVGRRGGMGQGACCQGRALPAQPYHPSETVGELNHGYREQNLPVTDGSRELHSLCAQLEFLLQVSPLLCPHRSLPQFPLGCSSKQRGSHTSHFGGVG